MALNEEEKEYMWMLLFILVIGQMKIISWPLMMNQK